MKKFTNRKRHYLFIVTAFLMGGLLSIGYLNSTSHLPKKATVPVAAGAAVTKTYVDAASSTYSTCYIAGAASNFDCDSGWTAVYSTKGTGCTQTVGNNTNAKAYLFAIGSGAGVATFTITQTTETLTVTSPNLTGTTGAITCNSSDVDRASTTVLCCK